MSGNIASKASMLSDLQALSPADQLTFATENLNALAERSESFAAKVANPMKTEYSIQVQAWQDLDAIGHTLQGMVATMSPEVRLDFIRLVSDRLVLNRDPNQTYDTKGIKLSLNANASLLQSFAQYVPAEQRLLHAGEVMASGAFRTVVRTTPKKAIDILDTHAREVVGDEISSYRGLNHADFAHGSPILFLPHVNEKKRSLGISFQTQSRGLKGTQEVVTFWTSRGTTSNAAELRTFMAHTDCRDLFGDCVTVPHAAPVRQQLGAVVRMAREARNAQQEARVGEARDMIIFAMRG